MEDPHYFIAIHLPQHLQKIFASWQDELKSKLHYKQWYHPQDFHITLKFLGAVNKEKLEDLISNLKGLEKHSTIELSIGSLGTFGKITSPRVLWVGVEKTKQLSDMQIEVEKIASQLGFVKENREYCPHITLAKKWDRNFSVDKEEMNTLLNKFIDMYPLKINEITLFQVHPNRKQKYEIVKQFRLS